MLSQIHVNNNSIILNSLSVGNTEALKNSFVIVRNSGNGFMRNEYIFVSHSN